MAALGEHRLHLQLAVLQRGSFVAVGAVVLVLAHYQLQTFVAGEEFADAVGALRFVPLRLGR